MLAFPLLLRNAARGRKRALAAAERAEAARGGPPLEANLASPKPMAHLESWTGTAPVKEDPGRETLAVARRLEADAPRSAGARELDVPRSAEERAGRYAAHVGASLLDATPLGRILHATRESW